MKTSRNAQQIVEYLLTFAAVVVVVLGASKFVGQKTGEILGDTLDGLNEGIYTYAWTIGHCDSCTAKCDGGKQICSFECQRDDGKKVGDSNCDGVKLDSTEEDCNMQSCPIDCKWDDDTISWGDCEPSCAEKAGAYGRRTGYKKAIAAQYDGAPCVASDGIVGPESCDVPACTGECGDGIVNQDEEECDGNDMGTYVGKDCVNYSSTSIFKKGSLSCNSNCTLNVSDCKREVCEDDPVPGECGEAASCTVGVSGCGDDGKCLDEYIKKTVACNLIDGDGIEVESFTKEWCEPSGLCEFGCEEVGENAEKCPDYNEDVMSIAYPVAYYDYGNCPGSDVPCAVKCSNIVNFGASSDGLFCKCLLSNLSDQIFFLTECRC